MPLSAEEATGDDSGEGADKLSAAMAVASVVWRYEMKPRDMRALAELGLRMEAFQGERALVFVEDGGANVGVLDLYIYTYGDGAGCDPSFDKIFLLPPRKNILYIVGSTLIHNYPE